MIRVAVIGTGSMGKNHVRVYSDIPDVEVVAVVDKNKELGKKIAKKFNTTYYGDYKKILDKVDAVSIAAPTKLHYKIAKDFLNGGVDVLVEKPITVKLDEADELIQLAEKKNRILQVGHIERFNPAITELKNFVKSKDILMISANRVGHFAARITDVGVVLDLMSHDIDIILSLIDDEIKEISAYGTKINSNHEDLACALLKFKKGAVAKITASRITQKRGRQLEITLKDKYLVLDYMNKTLAIHRDSKAEYITEDKNIKFLYSDVVETPDISQGEPLKLELQSFVDCVKTRRKPIVDGKAGRDALEVALRILDKINK